MQYTISSFELRQLFHDAMNIGRMDMAIQLNLLSDNLSTNQAKKIYKQRFKLWVDRGLIRGNKQGGGITSPTYYSRIQLEILDRTEKY